MHSRRNFKIRPKIWSYAEMENLFICMQGWKICEKLGPIHKAWFKFKRRISVCRVEGVSNLDRVYEVKFKFWDRFFECRFESALELDPIQEIQTRFSIKRGKELRNYTLCMRQGLSSKYISLNRGVKELQNQSPWKRQALSSKYIFRYTGVGYTIWYK